MSRMGAGETVVVKPSNDVYTALAAVALVAVIAALVIVWLRAEAVFGGLLSSAK